MTNIGNDTYVTDACNWVNYIDPRGKEFLLRAWQVEVINLVNNKGSIEDFILKLAKTVYGDTKSYFIIKINNVESVIAGVKRILQNAGHDVVVSNKDGLIDVDVVTYKAPTYISGWENQVIRFINIKKPIEDFLGEVIDLFFCNGNDKFFILDPKNPTRSIVTLNEIINAFGYRVILTTNNSSGYGNLRAV